MEIEDRTKFTLELDGQQGGLILTGLIRVLKEPLILGHQLTAEGYAILLELKDKVADKLDELQKPEGSVDRVKALFDKLGINLDDEL